MGKKVKYLWNVSSDFKWASGWVRSGSNGKDEKMLHHFMLSSEQRVVIRCAKPSDAQRVIQYIKGVSDETNFSTFRSNEFRVSVLEEERIIQKIDASSNQLMLIANIGETLVGMLTVAASHRNRLKHLGTVGITVLKAYWGMGIASRLLDMMIQWAERTHILVKLNLKVRVDNIRAIRLYLKKGFVVEGTLKKEFFVDGKLFDNYQMGYFLETV